MCASGLDTLKDSTDPILDWLEFINSKSKDGMEMLAKRNDSIKNATGLKEEIEKIISG